VDELDVAVAAKLMKTKEQTKRKIAASAIAEENIPDLTKTKTCCALCPELWQPLSGSAGTRQMEDETSDDDLNSRAVLEKD